MLSIYFHYIIIMSLSKRASLALYLNLFLSKAALCQVRLKMAQRFLRKIFSNVVKVFSLFHCNITPWERAWSFLWTNLNSLNPRMLYAFVFKICPVLLEKKIEMCWQVYRKTDEQTNGQTDFGQHATRIAHMSFQFRWAKNRNRNNCKEYDIESGIHLSHNLHLLWQVGNFPDGLSSVWKSQR